MLILAIKRHIDKIEIRTEKGATAICRLIPANCPFNKTVRIGKIKLFTIPPLCKLNPFYNELVGLRFRAECYLVENRHRPA